MHRRSSSVLHIEVKCKTNIVHMLQILGYVSEYVIEIVQKLVQQENSSAVLNQCTNFTSSVIQTFWHAGSTVIATSVNPGTRLFIEVYIHIWWFIYLFMVLVNNTLNIASSIMLPPPCNVLLMSEVTKLCWSGEKQHVSLYLVYFLKCKTGNCSTCFLDS